MEEKAEVGKDFVPFIIFLTVEILFFADTKRKRKGEIVEGKTKAKEENLEMEIVPLNNISYHEIAIYNHSFPSCHVVSCIKA